MKRSTFVAVGLFLTALVEAAMAHDIWTSRCDAVCGPVWTGTCVVPSVSAADPAVDAPPSTFHCLPPSGTSTATLLINRNDAFNATSQVYNVRHIDVDWTKLNVTSLVLAGVGDIDPVAVTFASSSAFRGLTNLSMSRLKATDLPPLPSTLRSLQLTACQLVDVPSSLPLHLTSLDLSSNLLTSFPSSIYALASLTHLNLSANPIPPQSLTPLDRAFASNLQSFQLDDATPHLVHSDPASPSSSSSASSLVVVLVGIGVGLLLLIAVFLYVLRRRHIRDRQGLETPDNPNPMSTMDHIYQTAFTSGKHIRPLHSILKQPSSSMSLASEKMSAFHATISADVDLARARLPLDSLVCTRLLAHSRTHLHEIYLGQCDDVAVVLKKVAATVSPDEIDTAATHLMDEMRMLGGLRHPHVVTLVGVAWDDMHAPVAATACGVMEYMNQGDLRSILDAAPLTWTDAKFAMALHIARACLYLHSRSPVLIHRDLRAQNVLVHRPLDHLDDPQDADDHTADRTSGGEFLCKLTNFTSARVRSYVDTMTSGVGSAKWVAPEVLRGDDYSERVDMYSFGVVLCELDTHALPFADRATDSTREDQRSLVQDIMTGKALPRFTPACPLPILQLAKQCLQLDPANRPTARAVVDTLERVVAEHAWGGRNGDGIYV